MSGTVCFPLKLVTDLFDDRVRPSVLAIISELGVLRQNAGTDRRAVVQQAVQLLEMLPDSITDQERASLLVPIDTGDLVPLNAGVCYYKGGVDISDGKTFVGHPLISEKLAGKIGMKHLGLDEAENDIDLGGKPITITRNTLKQYNPEQFFTEFIANASDAGAKRFTILVDDHEGPTERLLSEGVAVFQNASLVVHNDGIFSQNDFRGILQTGIGGKRGIIGHFGLGALSMFHFTEVRSGIAHLPNTKILIFFHLVGHDCFRRLRPFHEPIEAKLIVLRATFTSASFANREKVTTS